MGRHAGSPPKTYPYQYTDPDIIDAENLTAAAYYLLQAGRKDMADDLIREITSLFDGVEINRKRKDPCKTLGAVSYMPEGVITAKSYQANALLSVPAPPYNLSNGKNSQDGQDPDEDKARTKRIKAAIRSARLQWLPARQVQSGVLGEQLSVKFRPAVLLNKMNGIADAFSRLDEGTIAHAAPALAEKLEKLLAQNAVAADKGYSGILREMYNNTRYVRSAGPNSMAVRYLPATSVKKASDILKNDRQDQAYDLMDLPALYIPWTSVERGLPDNISELLRSGNKPGAPDIPFIRKYAAEYYKAQDGERTWNTFWQTDEYRLEQAMRKAAQAAIDVNNLMRLHAAIAAHGDKHITEQLAKAGVIDPDLEIPGDLHLRISACLMAGLVNQEQYRPADPELADMALAAAMPVMQVSGILDAMARHMPVINSETKNENKEKGGVPVCEA